MIVTINVNRKSGKNVSSISETVTQLQRSLDNRNGNISIAFKYVIGYQNITPGNAIVYFYIDEASGPEKVGMVPEGLYNLSMYKDALKDIIVGEASNFNIKPRKHNGRLEVKTKRPFAILKRDNSASSVLGFNTKSRREQITGKNISDTTPTFLTPRTLNLFVHSVDSRNNHADGKFSTLLARVPCSGGKFGDYITHLIINPLFKRLCNEFISELTVSVKDENDSPVQSNQPMTFVFEVRGSHTS